MEGSILRSIAVAVAEVSVALGADRELLVASLGNDDSERIPIEQLYTMWELAARATGDATLPIRVGASARFDRYGALGIALYVSRTMESALRRLCRYHDLLTDSGTWTIRIEGDDLVIAWDRRGVDRLGLRLANEQVLAAFVTVARQISTRTQIREVRLRHEPPSVDAHVAHFGAPVRVKAGENAVVMPAAYLQETPDASDPFVERFLLEQIETAAGTVRLDESFVKRVGRLIVEVLPDGVPAIDQIARQLDLSERTLRRRLTDAGTTFHDLLISLQRERALALLAGTYAIREVARAVGFADPSAFSRAFKRWTGTTPKDARAMARPGSTRRGA